LRLVGGTQKPPASVSLRKFYGDPGDWRAAKREILFWIKAVHPRPFKLDLLQTILNVNPVLFQCSLSDLRRKKLVDLLDEYHLDRFHLKTYVCYTGRQKKYGAKLPQKITDWRY